MRQVASAARDAASRRRKTQGCERRPSSAPLTRILQSVLIERNAHAECRRETNKNAAVGREKR
jgi:hypothetical protein